MKSPLIKLSFVLLAVVVLVLIIFSSFNQSQVTCEVCVTYRGMTQCRTASGTDTESARRTAQDNACTFISSGRAESIQCSSTQPDSLTCSP